MSADDVAGGASLYGVLEKIASGIYALKSELGVTNKILWLMYKNGDGNSLSSDLLTQVSMLNYDKKPDERWYIYQELKRKSDQNQQEYDNIFGKNGE